MECNLNLTHRISLPATWHKKTYVSPCHQQANRKLESSHRFIKDCIHKFSVDCSLEWDQFSPMQQLHSIGF